MLPTLRPHAFYTENLLLACLRLDYCLDGLFAFHHLQGFVSLGEAVAVRHKLLKRVPLGQDEADGLMEVPGVADPYPL